MKEEYLKPVIEEIDVEIEDVIASSNITNDPTINDTGWLPWV